MKKIKYKFLNQACQYINAKVATENLDLTDYISTENMLPGKGGIDLATALPDAKYVSRYSINDILTSNIRPYFKKIWFATKNGGCSNDVLILRSNKTTDARFLYYVLSDNNFFNYATVTSNGTKMPRGNKNAIMKYLIPDIPLPTQQRIADKLTVYDDLIENNNRRIELLEQSAQQIYKEWFVRFRFPGYETTHFTKGIPNGWEVVKLGEEISITSSKRIFLSDYVEKGIPFYRSREVIQLANGQAISESLYIEEEKYNQIKTKFGVPKINDILLTSVGTIGISLLIKSDKSFYFKDGNLTWLQSSKRPSFAQYLYLWLNSDSGKQQILASAIGTSQSALTIESLNVLKLMKPVERILDEFSKIITPINGQIENLQLQNQNLIKQRDLLLPRLMSGKLEV